MTIRELKMEEWDLLRPMFAEERGNLPYPETSKIMGAFSEDGSLVGFWCFQLAFHAGPLWIHPSHRKTRLWERLHIHLCELLRSAGVESFYSFSGQPKVESIFSQLGYKDLGWKVWTKEIK